MKKLFLAILLVALISGCSKNDNPVSSNNGNQTIIYQMSGILDSLGIPSTTGRINKLGILNIDSNCYVEFNYKTKFRYNNYNYDWSEYSIFTKNKNLSYGGDSTFSYDGLYHNFKKKCTGSGNDSCFFRLSLLNSSNSDTGYIVVKDLKIYK